MPGGYPVVLGSSLEKLQLNLLESIAILLFGQVQEEYFE